MANLNRRGIHMPFVTRTRRVEPPSASIMQPAADQVPGRRSMVDSAIYANGVRVASPTTCYLSFECRNIEVIVDYYSKQLDPCAPNLFNHGN